MDHWPLHQFISINTGSIEPKITSMYMCYFKYVWIFPNEWVYNDNFIPVYVVFFFYSMIEFSRLHDDVIKRKHFPHYWSFVRRIHQSQVNSLTKASDRSFDVFYDLRLNKRPGKQSRRQWFDSPSRLLWGHGNALYTLTLLSLDKMATILADHIFKCIFFN